jgi:hypothetical protein
MLCHAQYRYTSLVISFGINGPSSDLYTSTCATNYTIVNITLEKEISSFTLKYKTGKIASD